MKIESKIKIIDQFAFENNLDAAALIGNAHELLAEDFIQECEIGVSVAKAFVAGLCKLTEEGEIVINQTFERICDEMEVDSSKEYSDISDLHDEWRKNNE